jgi:tight adherence protein C
MNELPLFTAPVLTGISVTLFIFITSVQLGRVRTERKVFRVRMPVVFKVLHPFVPTFRPLARGPVLSPLLPQVERRLIQAGIEQELSAEDFISLRILHLITFTATALLFFLGGTLFHLMFGMFLWVYGAAGPGLWLHMTIQARHKAIQRALPNVLDLLTLSVEAGRDFMTALHEILRNRENDPLGHELERVFREVQLGKQRRAALRDMSDRVGDADLSSVTDALVQADELGVSIGAILRVLGDQMRQKRFHRAEKLANEAPVKLLIPLLLLIFPAVFIIMLGPVLMHALRSFL